MKRDYAILLLVLAVGVLTGFVVNNQQAPTRWEYATLTQAIDVTLETAMQTVERTGESVIGHAEIEMVVRQLGCRSEPTFNGLMSCLGAQGWEYASGYGQNFSIDGSELRISTSIFKRPVQ